MAIRPGGRSSLGVLLIDFNPVVREGLQAILTKDENIDLLGDAWMSIKPFSILNWHFPGDGQSMSC